jgi:hypothetical protein
MAFAGTALAHPLHTTLAELTYDAAARTFSVSLRVFADDFSAAVNAASGKRGAASPPDDSAMFRYVRERFAILSPQGASAPLSWCGARRVAETLLLCVRAASPWPITGARVKNALLTEVFSDQVNMVQSSHGGKRRLLLFTSRDGPKSL